MGWEERKKEKKIGGTFGLNVNWSTIYVSDHKSTNFKAKT